MNARPLAALALALAGCSAAASGWDGRLPPAATPSTPPQPQPGGDGVTIYLGPLFPYGAPYGAPPCPRHAPPYFAGGFKPRGPYSAWHGGALPLARAPNDWAGTGGYALQDPYARDPRDCGPARSFQGDEGRAHPHYHPPGGRR